MLNIMLHYTLLICMPKCWNGRRSGLKIRRTQVHEGSSPSFGTKKAKRLFFDEGNEVLWAKRVRDSKGLSSGQTRRDNEVERVPPSAPIPKCLIPFKIKGLRHFLYCLKFFKKLEHLFQKNQKMIKKFIQKFIQIFSQKVSINVNNVFKFHKVWFLLVLSVNTKIASSLVLAIFVIHN